MCVCVCVCVCACVVVTQRSSIGVRSFVRSFVVLDLSFRSLGFPQSKSNTATRLHDSTTARQRHGSRSEWKGNPCLVFDTPRLRGGEDDGDGVMVTVTAMVTMVLVVFEDMAEVLMLPCRDGGSLECMGLRQKWCKEW